MVVGGIDDWKFFLFVAVAYGWIFFWLRVFVCVCVCVCVWPLVVLTVVGFEFAIVYVVFGLWVREKQKSEIWNREEGKYVL